MAKRNALGKGLDALLPSSSEVVKSKPIKGIDEIELSKIVANPWQPRSHFDQEKLDELAVSIKQIGIVQPLTVRKNGSEYQLIAGERRYRASKIAGLTKVPAYVRTADDDTMLEMALVENIQRENLDPIEVAISYQRLIEECNLTQESMSERIGKKRATVTNYLRLLKLPAEIQLGLREKQLGMGHARTLLGLDNEELQLELYSEIVEKDLSVRAVEELVRSKQNTDGDNSKKSAKKTSKAALPIEYSQLQEQISDFFKSKVQFNRTSNGKGKIVIPFNSDDDLEKIIDALDKANSDKK